MNLPRWLLPALALLFLVGAGGVAWRSALTSPASSTSDRRAEVGGIEFEGKSTPHLTAGQTPTGPGSLPPHLRQLLSEIDRMAITLEEEFSYPKLLQAREEVSALLASFSCDDIETLIKFYNQSREHGLESSYVFGILFVPLHEVWGKLDPPAATRHVKEKARDRLVMMQQLVKESQHQYGIVSIDGALARPLSGHTSEIAAVYAGWAQRDPDAALEGWRSGAKELRDVLSGIARNTYNTRIEALGREVEKQVYEAWAKHDSTAAWERIRESVSESSTVRIRGFSLGLGADAPWANFAEEVATVVFDDPDDSAKSLAGFTAEWARHRPDAAVDWILDQQPEVAPHMFAIWQEGDWTGEGFAWITANASRLVEQGQVDLIGVGIRMQSHRSEEELLPLLRSLPRHERTWEILEASAGPGGFNAQPFAIPAIPPALLRRMVEELDPPAGVRQRIESELEEAEKPGKLPAREGILPSLD